MASQDLIFRFLGIDAGAGRQFDKLAGKATFASSAVAKLGIGVAAAGVGVAVASIKMASDFQKSMTLLQTQAGASAGEVKKMSSAVLGLAGPTATAPLELAKGLYHIESTGFRGAKALQILRVAAEGAKIGGADLEDVTNALNAAVASGIPGVQNMTQAMGALNAVVGSGDMRMQDLSDALGTGILSVAKGFGISLNDVGAALATFGDNNIRGADAATALRMAIMSLSKPAAGGKDAIEGLGLQMDTLAEAMQRGGLNAALTLLHDRLKATGNTGAKVGLVLTEAFGKKAGIGLQVLESQFGRFQSKVEEVRDGAEGFDQAWADTTKTFSYRFDRMRAAVEALSIRLGTQLLPIASDLIAVLTAVGTATGATVGFFTHHTEVTKLLAFALAAKLVPSLIATVRWLGLTAAVNIRTAFLLAADSATTLGWKLRFLGASAVASRVAMLGVYYVAFQAATGLFHLHDAVNKAKAGLSRPITANFLGDLDKQVAGITAQIDAIYNKGIGGNIKAALKNPFQAIIDGSGHTAAELNKVQEQLGAAYGNFHDLVVAFEGFPTPEAEQAMTQILSEMGLKIGDLKGDFPQLQSAVATYLAVQGGIPDQAAKVADAIAGLTAPVQTAQQAIDELTTTIKGLVNAPIAADEAAAKFTEDLQALAHAATGVTRSISLFTKAGRDNREKVRGLAGDVTDLVSKWVDEGQTVDQIRPKLLKHEHQLHAVARAFLGNKAAADQLLRRWHLLPSQIDQIAGSLAKAVKKTQKTAKDGGEKAGAALSAGVKAGQIAKHQLLDQAVDSVNSGIKTKGAKAAASAKATGLSIGAGLDAGVLAGLDSQRGAVLAQAYQMGLDAANEVKRGAKVKSPSQITTYVGQMIAKGLLTGFDGAAGKVYDRLSKTTRGMLDRLARDVQNAKSFKSSLRDQLSGYADITGATDSGVGVKTYLNAKLNDLRRFAGDLTRLSRMGLAPALLGQIAAAGPSALPVAEELLRMGRGGIRGINHTEAQIQRYANQAAATVTRDEFGARIHDDLQKLPDKLARAIRRSGALDFVFVDSSGHTVARLRRAG